MNETNSNVTIDITARIIMNCKNLIISAATEAVNEPDAKIHPVQIKGEKILFVKVSLGRMIGISAIVLIGVGFELDEILE